MKKKFHIMIIDGNDNFITKLKLKAEDMWEAKDIANEWLRETDEKTNKERSFHLKISDSKSYEVISL